MSQQNSYSQLSMHEVFFSALQHEYFTLSLTLPPWRSLTLNHLNLEHVGKTERDKGSKRPSVATPTLLQLLLQRSQLADGLFGLGGDGWVCALPRDGAMVGAPKETLSTVRADPVAWRRALCFRADDDGSAAMAWDLASSQLRMWFIILCCFKLG